MSRTRASNQYDGTVAAVQRNAANSHAAFRSGGDDEPPVAAIANDSIDGMGITGAWR